jgi:hypothetical protein
MLITAYEEPLLVVAMPVQMGWSSPWSHARLTAAQTGDALAPAARIVVQPGVLV